MHQMRFAAPIAQSLAACLTSWMRDPDFIDLEFVASGKKKKSFMSDSWSTVRCGPEGNPILERQLRFQGDRNGRQLIRISVDKHQTGFVEQIADFHGIGSSRDRISNK